MKDQSAPLVLKVLSDKRSLEILKIITVEPSYVKELASLLKTKESRISEKIKLMKEAGIISEEWKRLGNKLVKFFRPSVSQIIISFRDGSLRAETPESEAKEDLSYDILQVTVPEVGNFVGRNMELEFLENHRQVFITGIPGIGKTTLAAKFVSTHGEPVFWHEFRDVDTLKHVLMKIANHLANLGNTSLLDSLKGERDRRKQISLAISGLRASSTIVVFDDLHRCSDSETIEAIRDILQSIPKLKIILIGRENSLFYNSSLDILTLQEMRVEDAVKLIGNGSGSRKIVRQLGGHPLVLNLMKNSSPAKKRGGDITSLRTYVAHELLQSLPQNLRSIIEKASLFRGVVSLKDMEFVFGGVNKEDLRKGEELGLYKIRNNDIYVNDLIKESAYDSIENKMALHLKLSSYYKSKESPESLIEALYHLGRSGSNEDIVRFLDESGMMLVNSPYVNNFHKELRDIESSIPSCEAKAEVLYWIGKILSNKMNLGESLEYFRKSLLCPHSPQFKLRVLYDEGVILQNIGELEKSEEAFRRALGAAGQERSVQVGRVLYGLGYLLIFSGKIREARRFLVKAKNIFKEKEDSIRYGTTLYALAFAYYVGGNLIKALALVDDSLEVYLSKNATYSYATTLLEKGEILFSSGETDRALKTFNEGMNILNDLLGPTDSNIAYALIKRSLMEISIDRTGLASRDIERARRIVRDSSDKFLEGFLNLAQGAILAKKKRLREAEIKIRQALDREGLDPINMHQARGELGVITVKRGNAKEGFKILEKALEYLKKRGYVTFYRETKKIYDELKAEYPPGTSV